MQKKAIGTDTLTNNYIDKVIRTYLQPDRRELYQLFNRTEAITKNKTQKRMHFTFIKIPAVTHLAQLQNQTSHLTIKTLKKSQLMSVTQSIIQFNDD